MIMKAIPGATFAFVACIAAASPNSFVAVALEEPRWVFDPGVYVASRNKFTVKMPAGWLQMDLSEGGNLHVLASRDGPLLQVINCQRLSVPEFAGTEGSLDLQSMLPEELADLLVARISRMLQLQNLEVIENRPAVLGGAPAFRLLIDYRGIGNIRYRSLIYGALSKQSVFIMSYTAPTIWYFDRHLRDFDETVKTFQIG